MKDKVEQKEFSKLRNIFFPIYKHELKKIIPMSILFFCICYNYSVLRSAKDIFMLGESGAAAIYYLKFFGVTPAMFIFTVAYSYVSNAMGRDGRFNAVMGYFAVFFIIFLVLILPNQTFLQISNMDSMMEKFPKFSGFWAIIKNWHISLFYIHAEAWGSYAMAVLFWTFANEIINLKQAKRVYAFLLVGANIGAMAAGLSLLFIFKGNAYFILSVILALIAVALFTYNYLSKAIEKDPQAYQMEEKSKTKKKKLKMTFSESMSYLLKSKYMLLIATVVIGYGMSISLFESVWKDAVKTYTQGDKHMLSMIYGYQLFYVGLTTIIFVFFVSPFVRSHWTISAIITPASFVIMSCVFFFFMFFGNYVIGLIPSMHLNTLGIAVFLGLGNVVFIKAAKYAFFDPTKEQAYIPLDEESKVKGKAAVDGVGSRLGKSLGSMLITFVFLSISSTGKIGEVKHLIAITLITVLVGWLIATVKLGIKFNKLTKKDNNN